MTSEPFDLRDRFIEELRDNNTQEILLTSRLGHYKAREVDTYIASLQEQLQNLESLYQDRLEEMRTSLLGMTRERDERIHKIKALEVKLASASDVQALLAEQGMTGIPVAEYDRMLAEREQMTQTIERLRTDVEAQEAKATLIQDLERTEAALAARSAQVSQLEQERAALLLELAQVRNQLESSRQTLDQEIQAKNEILARYTSETESARALSLSLFERTQEIQSLQAQSAESSLAIETLQHKCQRLSEAAGESRSQHQLLQEQVELSQSMASRLMSEKAALEAEMNQRSQRSAMQREAMQARFQSMLSSQSEFLRQFQTHFNSSVAYLENLTETNRHILAEDPLAASSSGPANSMAEPADREAPAL
jgi:chromosome segregation ATPase